MQRQLDSELDLLKSGLIKMAALAETAIGKSVHALLLREVEPAEDVLRSDRAIDRLELEIDERCLQMLARYQPEACDLRLVAMALKIDNDLERVGDHATNIAEHVIYLVDGQNLKRRWLEEPATTGVSGY